MYIVWVSDLNEKLKRKFLAYQERRLSSWPGSVFSSLISSWGERLAATPPTKWSDTNVTSEYRSAALWRADNARMAAGIEDFADCRDGDFI